ncbi:MAG: hypothetical protein C5B50_24635 [Verrucomicrobia bacterium]|nr:MAG: hypothetical protein C5B50_24635 [Verrucomicrobiota bacterium]
MKKIFTLTAAVTVSVVCCVVAAYYCHYYYTLYHHNVTELESRINSFDMRLGTLEAHKCKELTPFSCWGLISTTDREADGDSHTRGGWEQNKLFKVENAKGGPVIRPEIRLAVGSSTNTEYRIVIEDQFGSVADAWLSHAEPYSNLAGFEEFKVYCDQGTNMVRLIARAKPGASFTMRFDLVLLCQK